MRSESEIQADIDAMKASGVHQSSGKLKPLREELKAARAAASPPPAAPPSEPSPTSTSEAHSAVGVSVVAEMQPVTRWGTEEAFIDAALVEIAAGLEFRGTTTGIVKNLYQRLDAVVKVRRAVKRIVSSLNPEQSWPQFSSLGLDHSTGEPVEPEAQRPRPIPNGVAPNVTEAGMPIGPGRPSKADIMAHVMGGAKPVNMAEALKADVMAQVTSRPEPLRELKSATA